MIFGLLLLSFITAWVDDMGFFFRSRVPNPRFILELSMFYEKCSSTSSLSSVYQNWTKEKKSKKLTKKLGEQSELHFKSSSFTYMCAWSGHFSEVGVDAKERATRENKMSLTTQKLTCGWRDPLLPISFAAETKKYIFDCWFWVRKSACNFHTAVYNRSWMTIQKLAKTCFHSFCSNGYETQFENFENHWRSRRKQRMFRVLMARSTKKWGEIAMVTEVEGSKSWCRLQNVS